MQNWQMELTNKCGELNMEAMLTLKGLTIVCPKLPGKKEKSQILSLVPEDIRDSITIDFEVAPKPRTLNHFTNIVRATGVVGSIDATPDQKTRSIKVVLTGNGNPESENTDWSKISEVFEKDGYFESWNVIFNGNMVITYNRKIVKELQRNNFHDGVIQKDEITNLKILLETEKNFDKLLDKL
jgi:hypothetical protein